MVSTEKLLLGIDPGSSKKRWALDAAMHDSGNLVFVAAVPAKLCDAVEQTLIWKHREQRIYNNQGKLRAPDVEVRLRHAGNKPELRHGNSR